MFPQMRDIVAAHQQQGHTVVILTSALNIHIEALARSWVSTTCCATTSPWTPTAG